MEKFEEHHEEFNYSYEDPFYLISLNEDGCNKLLKYIDGLSEDDWAIHQTNYKDKENFRLCDIHCPNQNSPMSTIGASIFELVNNKYYQFDISIFEFQLLRYREGGKFEWHCDYGTAPKKDVWRKLSLSVQLSRPEDYDGGELVIVDYYNQHCEIPKSLGASVVFDSRCPHKAEPITRGERYVLVGWASGPKLR
tara:strand:- start:1709 stop:2290 length:582 start_codon:yes stop_codon:yes gene_type:complete